MAVTFERIEEIQHENMAEDLPIDFDKMKLWTEEQVVEYFESGGEVEPPPAAPPGPPLAAAPAAASALPAPPMPPTPAPAEAPARHPDRVVANLLEEVNLGPLAPGLAPCSWDTLAAAHAKGRTALMQLLKDHGVLGVVYQQKLANAIGSAIRTGQTKSGLSVVHPCAVRRKNLKHLPPHKRLSTAAFASAAKKVLPGEWFGIPFPIDFKMLMEPRFGAEFLTKAFHAAGTLPRSNSVVRVRSIFELPLQGDDAQGGAGIKAIIDVEYAQPSEELHEKLFVKMPWLLEGNEEWRIRLSSTYGDGDGRELATYVFLEDLLPVRIPKFYFADISRESTNYILITECVPYGEADGLVGAAAVGKILPKSGKYQDDRLPNSHEYYKALMKGFGRVAGADKSGRFDEVIGFFAGGIGTGGTPKLKISDSRRDMFVKRASGNFDALINFATVVAPNVFPREVCDPAFLQRTKQQCLECARYFDEATAYAFDKPDFMALTHANLQIDNGFFWRTAQGELEAGLLDWYNFTRAPFAAIYMGCLSGAEPEVLSSHLESFMRTFAMEYVASGGPAIDPVELLLQFKLLYVSTLVNGLSFIESDILKEGPPQHEWRQVMSKEDPRVMGRWNVRCRLIAIMQSLAFWRAEDLHKTFMAWVKSGCGEEWKTVGRESLFF